MSEFTRGPWETRCNYWEAGVNDGTHSGWTPPKTIKHGECGFCRNSDGTLIRAYSKDGRSYHLHRFLSDDWHDIYSVDGTKVVGNYDYEEGGVCSSEADARLIAAAPEMFALLEKWLALDALHERNEFCDSGYCVTCEARALHARIVQFGPHAHAGVWISKETADEISRDGA